VVQFWKDAGMRPFLFPAMGSHGAATAAGQADVLGHFGITEAAMGCQIVSQLEVVSLGKTADGIEAFLDKAAYEADGEVWEREVLRNFIEDDRLTKIPDARKKRWVVLKWLARRFAVDSRYSEAEVNAVIKRHHPDAATLRRELIGYRMLERSKGIYRRVAESEWKPF